MPKPPILVPGLVVALAVTACEVTIERPLVEGPPLPDVLVAELPPSAVGDAPGEQLLELVARVAAGPGVERAAAMEACALLVGRPDAPRSPERS